VNDTVTDAVEQINNLNQNAALMKVDQDRKEEQTLSMDEKTVDLDLKLPSGVPLFSTTPSLHQVSLKTISDWRSYSGLDVYRSLISRDGFVLFIYDDTYIVRKIPVVLQKRYEEDMAIYRRISELLAVPIKSDHDIFYLRQEKVFPANNGYFAVDFLKFVETGDVHFDIRSRVYEYLISDAQFVDDRPEGVSDIHMRLQTSFIPPVLHSLFRISLRALATINIKYPYQFVNYFTNALNSDRFMVSAVSQSGYLENYIFPIEGDVNVLEPLKKNRSIARLIRDYAVTMVERRIFITKAEVEAVNVEIQHHLQFHAQIADNAAAIPGRLSRVDIPKAVLKYTLPSVTRTVLNWAVNEQTITPRLDTLVGVLLCVILCPPYMFTLDTRRMMRNYLEDHLVFKGDQHGRRVTYYYGLDMWFYLEEAGFTIPIANIEEFHDSHIETGFHDNYMDDDRNVLATPINTRYNGFFDIPSRIFGRRRIRMVPYGSTQHARLNADGEIATILGEAQIAGYDDFNQSLLQTNLDIVISRLTLRRTSTLKSVRNSERFESLLRIVYNNIPLFHEAMVAHWHEIRPVSMDYFVSPFPGRFEGHPYTLNPIPSFLPRNG
jgi:hypothetical protein